MKSPTPCQLHKIKSVACDREYGLASSLIHRITSPLKTRAGGTGLGPTRRAENTNGLDTNEIGSHLCLGHTRSCPRPNSTRLLPVCCKVTQPPISIYRKPLCYFIFSDQALTEMQGIATGAFDPFYVAIVHV